jgi:ribonuclease P protein component
MRFRTEQHLRRQADIKSVREMGRRVDCRAFTIWWKKRTATTLDKDGTGTLSRVCVIASSKAVGPAVQRNRAKRRLREVFRLQQHQVPPGCDLLLIARSAATTCVLRELEKKFTDACRQIASAAMAEST